MQIQESARTEAPQWYVLRDLKRANSKTPAYKVLPELGFEVFTPMQWVLKEGPKGGKTRLCRPYIPSLLFVKSLKPKLDEIIERTETLQYRYVKGAPRNTPMIVPLEEMTRFINAVTSTQSCAYYAPEEIGPDMIGRDVMIKGGPLDGQVGKLLKMRGSKKKRLIVDLKGIVVAAVEVEPQYIQFV